MRRQRALRIVALAFVTDADPFHPEVQNALVFFRRKLALDDQVAAAGVARLLNFTVEVGTVQVEQDAQQVSGHAHVHLQRIDGDGLRGQAHRQRLPVAIEDRAARRGDIDHHLLDRAGFTRVFPVMDNLQRD